MTTIHNSDDLFLFFRQHDLFKRFHLKKIGVFGSFARGEKFKDIDLLVEDDIDYRQLLELKQLIEIETGFKVDIVQRKYAEPVILYRALKEVKYAAAS
jgi:predicted nucleotidyltransferase